MAYAVEDIKAEMARLECEDSLCSTRAQGRADNKWVCFLRPKGTGGTLIELCQDRG